MARILILEDRLDACYFMSLLLKTEGHDVTPFVSVANALSAFGKGKFELVILDMDSTNYDALEILERMRVIDEAITPILISSDCGRHIESVKRAGFKPEFALADRPVTAAQVGALVRGGTDR